MRWIFFQMLIILSVLLILAGVTSVNAQSGSSETQLRLDVERAELDREVAREQLRRKEALFEQGLLSAAELRMAQADLRRAEIDETKTKIGLSNDLPSFRIVSATKRVEKGESRVDLVLHELQGITRFAGRRYLISVNGPSGIIGDPYQVEVLSSAGDARQRRLRFRLLKDVDELTVVIASGTRREEIPIYLQRDTNDRRILITAQNYSQEAPLDDKVDYPLQLDRFSRGGVNLELVAKGIPDEITHEWIDAETRAKLNGLRFRENENRARVILRLFVPAESRPAWFESVVPFRVEIVDGGTVAGSAQLQIKVMGNPALLLTTDNLLVHVRSNEEQLVLMIQNTGGVAARDVRFEANLPIGLQADFSPATIPVLGPKQRKAVKLTLRRGDEAVSADYNVKVQALTTSRLANVASPEVSLRVIVGSSTEGWRIAVAIMVALVVAIWLWIVASRRRAGK